MMNSKTIKSLKHIPNIRMNPLMDRLFQSMAIKSWVSFTKRYEAKNKIYFDKMSECSVSTLKTDQVNE